MGNPSNLIPFQFKKGQSGNPNGRPSDRDAVALAIKTTRDGLELVETLIDLMRNAKAEKTRLAATCELWDRIYGRVPSGERPSLFGELARGAAEVQFSASFGPRLGDAAHASESTAIEIEAHHTDTAESYAADAETPVESPVEIPE